MLLLLVARPGEARDAYVAELERLGVEYDLASSFGEVPRLAGEKPYNGLLIDLLTLVRTRSEDKNIAYECINFYPSTRIKWERGSQSVHVLSFDQAPNPDGSALQAFVEDKCRPFQGRTLRRFSRKEIVMNVRLGRSLESVQEEGLKTFTGNISRGGAFVHTVEPYEAGERVWLVSNELFSGAPASGLVCWQQAWGKGRSIPGIGIRFDALTEEQAAELAKVV